MGFPWFLFFAHALYRISQEAFQNMKLVFGYKGKQVRDNIHSYDVVKFIEFFIDKPRIAEVYNIGGGRDNSISILEAFDLISSISRWRLYQLLQNKRRSLNQHNLDSKT